MTVHTANRTVPYDVTCKVESYGDITVPVGTFKAFKVGCSSTLPTEEIYWFSPEMGLLVKSSVTRVNLISSQRSLHCRRWWEFTRNRSGNRAGIWVFDRFL